MPCEYCLQIGGKHDYRCPLAPEPKFKHYCSICTEGICDGEEYIRNDDGEYAHLDCSNEKQIVEFLGYEVKIMENENDEY